MFVAVLNIDKLVTIFLCVKFVRKQSLIADSKQTETDYILKSKNILHKNIFSYFLNIFMCKPNFHTNDFLQKRYWISIFTGRKNWHRCIECNVVGISGKSQLRAEVTSVVIAILYIKM